jgi:hypothetical protein
MNETQKKMIKIENQASHDKIAPIYLPIIQDVKRTIPSMIGANLVEIRILGSVPRGNAIRNISDIDFLIITERELSKELKNEVVKLSEALHKSYPYVWSVDLTIMDIQSIQKAPDYELILSTDSISIFSDDHYTKPFVEILNTELNDLWGLTPIHLDEKYHLKLCEAATDQEIRKVSKWIGKDMLKCFRRKIISDYAILDRQIEPLYKRLVDLYPDFHKVFEGLWSLYSSPDTDKNRIESIFDISLKAYRDLVQD